MITIVVGGQYGGEGKGKFCSYLALRQQFDFVCRTGGVNSSHTVRFGERIHKLRMMPASAVVQRSTYLFGAGTLIDPEVFQAEMAELDIPAENIVVDHQAGIIGPEIRDSQKADAWYTKRGSTLTGTGHASAARCLRRLPLASEIEVFKPLLGDVVRLLHDAARSDAAILLEGHQGAGLSNYHGDYPFTSSRDCIAASLLSEVGLGLRWPTTVILAVKVFPTRNHAGRLPGELSPEAAAQCGIEERGGGSDGVPDRIRRVGRFELSDVLRAIMLNTPDLLALQGFDYAFPELRGARTANELSPEARHFIRGIEEKAGVPVGLISTGPDAEDTVDLREQAAELPAAARLSRA